MGDPRGTSEALTYVVVSPVKDEQDFLETTARALADQTLRPARWVIVDDGSSDATPQIAARLAEEHDWISVVSTQRSGGRARGGPIVRAFNQGWATAQGLDPAFVVKLDGDIHVPPHYFAWVAETFARDPRAGVVGGLVLIHDGTEWLPDPVNRRSVHGCAKAYRVTCLEDIGGLPDSMGWDGIDELAARARGWQVHVLTELSVLHFKQRGSKQRWTSARWEEGVGMHFMGYIPSAVLLRVGYRALVERPPVAGGMLLGLAYCWSWLRRAPQYPDAAARAQLATEQRQRVSGLLRRQRHLPPPALPGGGPAFWSGVSDRRDRT